LARSQGVCKVARLPFSRCRAKTVLFCAWLAFSQFRIVLVMRDRTSPNVFSALERCFRSMAGMPVRNPQSVAFSKHYSTVIHTCQPADPAAKGGVEKTVHLAKADVVPTDTKLLPD